MQVCPSAPPATLGSRESRSKSRHLFLDTKSSQQPRAVVGAKGQWLQLPGSCSSRLQGRRKLWTLCQKHRVKSHSRTRRSNGSPRSLWWTITLSPQAPLKENEDPRKEQKTVLFSQTTPASMRCVSFYCGTVSCKVLTCQAEPCVCLQVFNDKENRAAPLELNARQELSESQKEVTV
jgi:hypothetical protein